MSGDNASLDAVREVAERFGPVDTAVLFVGAPRIPQLFDDELLVLDSAQAAEGVDDLEVAFAQAGLADRLDLSTRP